MSPRAVVAASSGNVLEWYDFTVYAFLAPTIGKIFFPAEDEFTSILSAFAVLAVGYIARPIGSVIYGHIGDRLGRKPALLSSIVIMGIGSLAIGLLPTPGQIGMAASILLVGIRIVQGISVAGEYTASGVLIVEQADERSRGFVGSWIAFAMIMGCVLGSGIPALVSTLISPEQLATWGWRVPFLLGSAIAACSAFLRVSLPESAAFNPKQGAKGSPITETLRHHWRLILQMVGLLVPTAVIYFLIFVYAASYLTEQAQFSSATALDITTINLVVIAFLGLAIGWLSDRVGRRALFLAGAMATMLFTWPLWWLMHQQNVQIVFLGQLGFSAINAIGWALSITLLTEIAPPNLRCSAVALGYNLCMALFGGTTPIVATYLVNRTGDDFVPVYYVLVATLVSLFVIVRLPANIVTKRT
jgi:MFS transporter, MHS family, proline/betaine transporter